MPELIAVSRIATPEGVVEPGDSFTCGDESAAVHLERGDATEAAAPKPAKPKKPKKDETSEE